MQEYRVYWLEYDIDEDFQESEKEIEQIVQAKSDQEALELAFKLDHDGIFCLYKGDEIIGTEEFDTIAEYQEINKKG